MLGGLWALGFPDRRHERESRTLFFTDGINGEVDGLFAA
jgi:hypothetical protein